MEHRVDQVSGDMGSVSSSACWWLGPRLWKPLPLGNSLNPLQLVSEGPTVGCCPWCWRCSCPRASTSPIFRGAGLGSCQEHTVINQQVWNGKPNSKGGRRNFFIGLLNLRQRSFLTFFLSFLTKSHVFDSSHHLGLNWTSQFLERSTELSSHYPGE